MFGVSALFGLIALIGPSDEASATRHAATVPAAPVDTAALQPVSMALPLPPGSSSAAPAPQSTPVEPKAELQWHEVTVRSGDTLAAIFDRLHIGPAELYAVMESDRNKTATLKQILPGQTLRFGTNTEGDFEALQYKIDRLTTLDVERNGDNFTASYTTRPVETRLAYTSATIDSSLFAAGQRTGLSDTVIMELAAIFGWDVDFALDIRSGDSFTVVYEQKYLDGEKLSDGDILAAEFVNQGQVFRAIRFTDPDGNSNYYTPEGLSMRKAFLRTPVDFRRISSRFSRDRCHPILGVCRPHKGVDYAAPIGTPIKSAGDGKIIFRGRKGGYGNVIIIQHGGAYSTLYGHMSKFRGGLHVGSRVRQGQVIGYVGQSGLATGPHLHYEFRVNGVHRNPLTVKLPNAAPIPAEYREAFEQQARMRLTQLDTVRRTTVALNNNP